MITIRFLPKTPTTPRARKLRASLLIATAITGASGMLALPGCSLPGPQIGPPDLDTTSAAAPRCAPLHYPSTEQMAGNRGDTVVKVQVTRDGRILSPEVATSSGYTALDDASIEAARRWCRFEPSTAPDAPASRVVKITFVWDFIARAGTTDIPVSKVGIQPSLQ